MRSGVLQATNRCPVCQAKYSHGRFAHFQPSVENPKMEWDTNWIDAGTPDPGACARANLAAVCD